MGNNKSAAGFGRFVVKNMLPVFGIAVAALAVLWVVIQYFEVPEQVLPDQDKSIRQTVSEAAGDAHAPAAGHGVETSSVKAGASAGGTPVQKKAEDAHVIETTQNPAATHSATTAKTPESAAQTDAMHTAPAADTQAAGGHGGAPVKTYPVVGMAFVNAVIQPMDYELNRRFFGWRPNDVVEWTDNVNNFQLGVLEVTRRTSRILAERISRTGSTARFEPNLENAMNWFMIKADRYWFPSAESKYRDGLKELREYFHKLELGEAEFYTRTDNLIPLLEAFEDLLGSCDENLVKRYEPDGTPVSFFKADDYFFYAQGVASTMLTLLEAIAIDFNIMVSREGGLEVLHNAIESCHHAVEIDPWLVMNSNYSSIFANHRANMAGPISHARFYLGVLIKSLST